MLGSSSNGNPVNSAGEDDEVFLKEKNRHLTQQVKIARDQFEKKSELCDELAEQLRKVEADLQARGEAVDESRTLLVATKAELRAAAADNALERSELSAEIRAAHDQAKSLSDQLSEADARANEERLLLETAEEAEQRALRKRADSEVLASTRAAESQRLRRRLGDEEAEALEATERLAEQHAGVAAELRESTTSLSRRLAAAEDAARSELVNQELELQKSSSALLAVRLEIVAHAQASDDRVREAREEDAARNEQQREEFSEFISNLESNLALQESEVSALLSSARAEEEKWAEQHEELVEQLQDAAREQHSWKAIAEEHREQREAHSSALEIATEEHKLAFAAAQEAHDGERNRLHDGLAEAKHESNASKSKLEVVQDQAACEAHEHAQQTLTLHREIAAFRDEASESSARLSSEVSTHRAAKIAWVASEQAFEEASRLAERSAADREVAAAASLAEARAEVSDAYEKYSQLSCVVDELRQSLAESIEREAELRLTLKKERTLHEEELQKLRREREEDSERAEELQQDVEHLSSEIEQKETEILDTKFEMVNLQNILREQNRDLAETGEALQMERIEVVEKDVRLRDSLRRQDELVVQMTEATAKLQEKVTRLSRELDGNRTAYQTLEAHTRSVIQRLEIDRENLSDQVRAAQEKRAKESPTADADRPFRVQSFDSSCSADASIRKVSVDSPKRYLDSEAGLRDIRDLLSSPTAASKSEIQRLEAKRKSLEADLEESRVASRTLQDRCAEADKLREKACNVHVRALEELQEEKLASDGRATASEEDREILRGELRDASAFATEQRDLIEEHMDARRTWEEKHSEAVESTREHHAALLVLEEAAKETAEAAEQDHSRELLEAREATALEIAALHAELLCHEEAGASRQASLESSLEELQANAFAAEATFCQKKIDLHAEFAAREVEHHEEHSESTERHARLLVENDEQRDVLHAELRSVVADCRQASQLAEEREEALRRVEATVLAKESDLLESRCAHKEQVAATRANEEALQAHARELLEFRVRVGERDSRSQKHIAELRVDIEELLDKNCTLQSLLCARDDELQRTREAAKASAEKLAREDEARVRQHEATVATHKRREGVMMEHMHSEMRSARGIQEKLHVANERLETAESRASDLADALERSRLLQRQAVERAQEMRTSLHLLREFGREDFMQPTMANPEVENSVSSVNESMPQSDEVGKALDEQMGAALSSVLIAVELDLGLSRKATLSVAPWQTPADFEGIVQDFLDEHRIRPVFRIALISYLEEVDAEAKSYPYIVKAELSDLYSRFG